MGLRCWRLWGGFCMGFYIRFVYFYNSDNLHSKTKLLIPFPTHPSINHNSSIYPPHLQTNQNQNLTLKTNLTHTHTTPSLPTRPANPATNKTRKHAENCRSRIKSALRLALRTLGGYYAQQVCQIREARTRPSGERLRAAGIQASAISAQP